MSRNPVGVGNSLVLLPRVARGSQPWALRRNPVGIEFRNATPFKFVKLRFLSQDECRLSSKLTCELTLPPPLPRRTARFREFAGQTIMPPNTNAQIPITRPRISSATLVWIRVFVVEKYNNMPHPPTARHTSAK